MGNVQAQPPETEETTRRNFYVGAIYGNDGRHFGARSACRP